MCNCGVNTLSQPGVAKYMLDTCDELQALRSGQAAIKIIYGGPVEMWKSAASAPDIFEQKAQTIRDYLTENGMDVESGAEDYRSQFHTEDLDALGHFLGSRCRDRCERWLENLILRFSYPLWTNVEVVHAGNINPGAQLDVV